MKKITSTKLTVEMSQPDSEKHVKQNFANVVAEPDEAAVLQLGAIVAGLAPDDNDLVDVLETAVYTHEN